MDFFNTHALIAKTPHSDSSLHLPAPWTARAAILALLLLVCAGSAQAQVNASWLGGNGSWLAGANWSSVNVPNNSVNTTYNVTMTKGGTADINNFSIVINNLTSSSVNFNTVSVTSGSLTLASGTSAIGGSIDLLSSSSLYVQSTATAAVLVNGGIGNLNGSDIQVYGVLDNSGIVNNAATLINHSGAMISNSNNLSNLSGGTLTNNFGGTIDNFAIFTNFANATINNAGAINLFSGMTNNGTLNNYGTINTCIQCASLPLDNGSVGTFNNGGTVAFAGSFHNSGAFNNSALDPASGLSTPGTFTLLSGGSFSNGMPSLIGGGPLPGYFTNPGMLNINSGAMFTNGAGSTLDSSGSILVAGTFNNDPGAMVTLNPQPLPPGGIGLPAVQIDAGGVFNNAGSLVSARPPPNGVPAVQINSGGMFNNMAGGTLDTSGQILVAGTFNNDPGAMVTLNPQPLPPGGIGLPAVQIDAGGVFNNNGTITWTRPPPVGVPAVQINFGGTLMGNGTINGDVMNGGMVSPGNSPGIMTINGNYIQTSGGAYTAELGGLFAGQYDQLNISGTASLAGTLNVSLVNSFIVSLGNSFIILNASSITGTFGILHLPTIGPGLFWTLAYNPTNVTLTAAQTPEPGTLLLVATGLAGAFFRRRRSRRA